MPGHKILIADDDKQFLTAIRLRLEHEGYDVTCAHDGQAAVQLSQQISPDLLILDVHMPTADGFVSLEIMDTIPDLHNLPVIYVTGDDTEETARNAEMHGAMAVLQKPIDMGELIETIELLIGDGQSLPSAT